MNTVYILKIIYKTRRTSVEHYFPRGLNFIYVGMLNIDSFQIYCLDRDTGVRKNLTRGFILFQRIWKRRRIFIRRALKRVYARERLGGGSLNLAALYEQEVVSASSGGLS